MENNQNQNNGQNPVTGYQQQQSDQYSGPQGSLNAFQQMQYEDNKPKKRILNSLMITLAIVVFLIVTVVVAAVIISGQRKTPIVVEEGSSGQQSSKEDSSLIVEEDDNTDNTPKVSDAGLVVQNFYDVLLTTLRQSQSKLYTQKLQAYAKGNQDLTSKYQTKLLKAKGEADNPLMLGMTRLPSTITYSDPTSNDRKGLVAKEQVTLNFGSEKRHAIVTLKWNSSVTNAGYWQIDNIAKK